MRILDSKDPRDRPIADMAPDIDAYLTPEARAFFEAVVAGLEAAGVQPIRNPRLVRGLDYYRHTAFEFVTDRLGAQGTVLAGGRYDGLIESLGGPATAGVGWAAGVERLAMLVPEPPAAMPDVTVIPDVSRAEGFCTAICACLRREGFAVDQSFKGSPTKRFDRAKRLQSRFVMNVGMFQKELGESYPIEVRLRSIMQDDANYSEFAMRLYTALERHFDMVAAPHYDVVTPHSPRIIYGKRP